MKYIWIISKRELQSFFDSLMAYIMLFVFLGFSGFFTWISGNDIFMVGQASLQSFFGIAYWTLFFFIPALTMPLFAEEFRSGTIELLLTKPVSLWQVIGGKFLSTFLLIMIALVCTLPYYITVASIGKIDHGAVWSGYFGLMLMSATYICIGIFASSISKNQIIGFLLALLFGIFFHIIFGILASSFTGTIGGLFDFLSLSTHYDSITRGVIDSKDLLYFGSIIFLSLVGTESILSRRNS
ncbi:MAG: ABC transporter permease [Bacteroidia bacterium]|nr:ABC transporter permease [Bacteroidia bacterium]